MGLLKLVTALSAVAVNAIELSTSNWDKETEGKTLFIKFLAPWWGHCKSMKPAWDKLMEAYKGHPTSLVADVDCTAAGQDLCQKQGVQGYPSIKYGDPAKLKDYQGGRDFDSLKQFADSNLGPKCSPENLKLCKGKQKEAYEKFMKLDSKELEKLTRDKRKELKEMEEEVKVMKDVGRYQRKLERADKAKARKAEREAKKKADKEKKEL